MSATISAHALQQMLTSSSVILIDVLLPEDFAVRHIAGAVNACVYEMLFMDRISECVPDLNAAVVVYDDSGTTLAAGTAKEKLERAGYRNVAILEGGLQRWRESGFPTESNKSDLLPPSMRDGIFRVDTEKSMFEWIGRNINNRHYGRIGISEGEVVVSHGRPESGSLILDMNTITNLDIKDDGWRSMLIRHLKSDDFFDVERFPTATFELLGAAEIADATLGTPNMEIAGSLTVKGITRSICCPAIIALQEDGTLKAQAELRFDRTNWNVCYGSGKLYERLGMHLVNDLITIELFVVARITE